MLAYEFYRDDPEMGYQLIGILPERRNDSERINTGSIMNWVKGFLNGQEGGRKVFYVQVELEGRAMKDS